MSEKESAFTPDFENVRALQVAASSVGTNLSASPSQETGRAGETSVLTEQQILELAHSISKQNECAKPNGSVSMSNTEKTPSIYNFLDLSARPSALEAELPDIIHPKTPANNS